MVVKPKQSSAQPQDSEVKKKMPWWRLFLYSIGLLVWVLASIVVSQLLIGYLLIWVIGSTSFQEPLWQAVYSALSYTIAMLLIILLPLKIVGKHKKKPLDDEATISLKEQLGLQSLVTWGDIGLALVGFFAYLLLAAGITATFQAFPWFNAEEVQNIGFNSLNSGTDRIIAFVTLVVIAPIAEEVIFRGWLYGKLRRKFSDRMSNYAGMALAIFLVSLLFGIVHMQWNVGVNVFAMSIVLCGLREITGTIHAGILLHMLKNGIAFYLLYVAGF